MSNSRNLLAGLAGLILMSGAAGMAHADGPAQPAAHPPTVRDGSHDFDFIVGTWHTHVTRVLDPFDGGKHTVTLEGTVTERAVWNGRAWFEEIEADGPNGHWEGATLFLYDPAARQWSQTFINSASGAFQPGMIGAFKNGKAELYMLDTLDGRSVLLRATWSDIKANSHRYEEHFSDDGGRTWVMSFSALKTKAAS